MAPVPFLYGVPLTIPNKWFLEHRAGLYKHPVQLEPWVSCFTVLKSLDVLEWYFKSIIGVCESGRPVFLSILLLRICVSTPRGWVSTRHPKVPRTLPEECCKCRWDRQHVVVDWWWLETHWHMRAQKHLRGAMSYNL
jgi:hypothetical protein